MVNKKLLKRVEELEKENKAIKEYFGRMLNSLKSINKRLNSHVKNEKANAEEETTIKDWLSDERLDEIQDFLHKGVK